MLEIFTKRLDGDLGFIGRYYELPHFKKGVGKSKKGARKVLDLRGY